MNGGRRLVLFDLGGTLLRLDKPEVFWRLLIEGGADVPYEVVRHAFHRADRFFMEHLPRLWHSGAELRDRAIFNRVLRDLGVSAHPETLRRALQRSDHWTPFGDALPVLDALRERGLRAGLITNWNPSARAVLAEYGLLHRLDPIVVSSEVGREKPDREIFRMALRRAGVAPSAALYVGDNYWDDVLGARAAGLEAVLVDRRPDWTETAYDCPVIASLHGLLSTSAGRATAVGDPLGGDPRGGGLRGGGLRGGGLRGDDPRGDGPWGGDPRGDRLRGGDPRGGDPRGGGLRGDGLREGGPREDGPRPASIV